MTDELKAELLKRLRKQKQSKDEAKQETTRASMAELIKKKGQDYGEFFFGR